MDSRHIIGRLQGRSSRATYTEGEDRRSQKEDAKFESPKYFSHNYSLDITYTILKLVNLSSDFDYFINSGRTDGFNQSIPLWNVSASKYLFKKKNGEVRFSVYDIMNQNKSITRNIGDNYIEDDYTQVLRRFFMVSFMYNLNKFGGKKSTGMGVQRSMQPRTDFGGSRSKAGRGNTGF